MSSRRVGISFGPLERRRDLVVELSVRADQLGYDSVSLGEGWTNDAFLLLGEIGARTERIRLITDVVSIWSRSPGTIAMSAVTLQEQTGGRFVLGLGASSKALTEGFHDIPYQDPLGRLRTTIEQVRALLAHDRIPVSTGARPLKLGGSQVPRVPLWVAALADGALGVVGELADGWLPYMLPSSRLAGELEKIAAARTGSDDPPDGLVTAPTVATLVSRDGSEAREIARKCVIFYVLAMGEFYPAYLSKLGFVDEIAALRAANERPNDGVVATGTEALLDDLTIHGDPTTIDGSIERWFEAGADELLLFLPPGAPEELMRETIETLAPGA